MTARYIAIDWGSTNLAPGFIGRPAAWRAGDGKAGVARLNGKSPAAVLASSHDRLA
ncbi:hypothetical protein ACNKHW_23630 [Shigella flexneri]